MPRALATIPGGLLGAVVLGYPLFLTVAVLLATVVNSTWGLLLVAVCVLAFLVLTVTWLRRPAEIWRFHGAFLLGGLLGGAFWFSRFGLSGLV